MSDLKVGDTVWFFYDKDWLNSPILFPSHITLIQGKIVDEKTVDEKVRLCIYVKNRTSIIEIEYIKGHTEIYTTKEFALTMLFEELECMRDENAN